MKLLSIAILSCMLPQVCLSQIQISKLTPQPLIYDTDHGPFIDDIFALGLLLNSRDLIDPKLIIGTSNQSDLSTICIAAQLNMSGVTDIPVAIGEDLPPYEDRGGMCAIPGIMGFGMEPACREVYNSTQEAAIIEDGVAYAAQMIEDSGRDDWWYLVVGGQTSLKRLILDFPEAASKIETLVVMGGNWCSGFEPFPDVMAPTDETNISCDPQAANDVLDGNNIVFPNVYYVPVVVADEIGGLEFARIVESADSGDEQVARATLDLYTIWSEASRADPDLLVYEEAMEYDPSSESVPQYDAMAIMLILELLEMEKEDHTCGDGRISLHQFEAIHFFENEDEGLQMYPESPRSAFSIHAGTLDQADLPEDCPSLTPYTFDPNDTPEEEYPIMAALGFVSPQAKEAVYRDMASRLAGETTLCAEERSNVGSGDLPLSLMTTAIVVVTMASLLLV